MQLSTKKMKPIDLSPLFEKYKGQWVALDKFEHGFKVVSNGRKPATVYQKALKSGVGTPVIMKISSKLQSAIF